MLQRGNSVQSAKKLGDWVGKNSGGGDTEEQSMRYALVKELET